MLRVRCLRKKERWRGQSDLDFLRYKAPFAQQGSRLCVQSRAVCQGSSLVRFPEVPQFSTRTPFLGQAVISVP
ncbi:hypothetical protein RRG08_053023 [Elysia crispata]|uniref:Uncharacterized protein n=1 Tax=Elysia crispata TaxID=231223 RepID=A0AAE1CSV6_9GAST|nr:hypothetical protein RRG08_053023 [Elysia crispata]